ncbi:uncharacterized protein J3R85_020019 [Psidium guajava]|nr:uncharacterized protein J3R85_020019 [Psidium guajava]
MSLQGSPEGAEEFILKPVRLSDVNKLRPHMMRTKKLKNEQQEPREELERHGEIRSQLARQHELEIQQGQHHQSQQIPQHQQQKSGNNNKRKAIDVEEGLSPDRTRNRYSGVASF